MRLQSESPEEPGMRRAVAVAGQAGHVGSFHGLTGASAFDRCRIGQPKIVVPGRAGTSDDADDVLHRGRGVAESLVVGGPLRQVREHGPQVSVRVADEPGFGREPEQCLDHGQGDQFSIGELWCDPDLGSFWHPFGMVDQQVVDGHVKSGRERV